jgi:phage tail sheath protein FI
LWAKITASLTLFLRELFLQGALVGNTQDDAFFVKCNDETNTADGTARGEVVAEIGFASARPAEFILVTIKRTAASLSVRESSR